MDPLILSPDDLEEISKFGQEINEAGEEEFTDIGRENKGLKHKQNLITIGEQ